RGPRPQRLPPAQLRRKVDPPASRRERAGHPRGRPGHDRSRRAQGALTVLGLDHWLAGFSDGTTLLVVALVAIVLGLRHATDPDHLAAVTTLVAGRSEEHTSELQSRSDLVCRLLLEKK